MTTKMHDAIQAYLHQKTSFFFGNFKFPMKHQHSCIQFIIMTDKHKPYVIGISGLIKGYFI